MNFLTRIMSNARIILLPTLHGGVSSGEPLIQVLHSGFKCFADRANTELNSLMLFQIISARDYSINCKYRINSVVAIVHFQLWAPVGQWLARCVSISLLRVGVRIRFP